MTRRVVFNQKGGVGKTTIVCNLAAVAAARGQRTLVIDLDTQANATRYLLGSEDIEPTRTVADFFESTLSFTLGTDPFERYATETPFENLDVVVASPELDSLQPKLEAKPKHPSPASAPAPSPAPAPAPARKNVLPKRKQVLRRRRGLDALDRNRRYTQGCSACSALGHQLGCYCTGGCSCASPPPLYRADWEWGRIQLCVLDHTATPGRRSAPVIKFTT